MAKDDYEYDPDAPGMSRGALYMGIGAILLFVMYGVGHCVASVESDFLSGNLVAELPFGNIDDGILTFEVKAPAMTHRLELDCSYRPPKGSDESGRLAAQLTGPDGRVIATFRDRFSHTRRSFTFKPSTTGTYEVVVKTISGCDYPTGFVRVNDHRIVSPILQYIPWLY